jgi:hypothetical protein
MAFLITAMSAEAQSTRQGAAPEVRVILWFDTEDYLLPADDDATKRLCEMLSQRGIRATFKLVGEKARVLEKRGRKDVIAALKKHDIGYHSDFHSVHPTPTEYLADCGWQDGIAEFARREGDGAADVRRILGVRTLSCYGQPGSSWGPQTVAALPRIGVTPRGVACYVDEGSHVGIDGKPFWYAGALNVYHMGPNWTRMDLHDPSTVEPAKQKVTEIANRMRSEGGGLISIFYHPCEWVHREFWDGVNFSRGANPPREQWKPPRQRTAEETESAFQRFGQYVDHISGIPGVRWITATDLPALYPDPVQTAGSTDSDVDAIAAGIAAQKARGLDYQRFGARIYSLAEQFDLLTQAIASRMYSSSADIRYRSLRLLGPESAAPAAESKTVSWLAFRDTVRDVREYIQSHRAVPPRVFVGPDSVSPGAFLVALAEAWQRLRKNLAPPSEVTIGANPRILPERHVAQDTPELFGGWVIHRAGFRAPKVMELARLQAWTLKPAVSKP